MGQARVEPGLRTSHPTACCALAPPPRLPGKAARRAGAWPARRGRGPARPRPPPWGWVSGGAGWGARAGRFGGAEEPPPPPRWVGPRVVMGRVRCPATRPQILARPSPRLGPASPPGAESPRPWGTAQVTPHGNPEGGRGARKRLAQRPRKLGLEPGGALTCPDPHRLRGCAQGPPAALLRSRC